VAEMVLRGGRRSQLLDVLWRRPAQPVTSPPSR